MESIVMEPGKFVEALNAILPVKIKSTLGKGKIARETADREVAGHNEVDSPKVDQFLRS